MKYSDAWLRKTVRCWEGTSLAYVDREVKIDAHKRACRVLQSFATDYLKLDKGEYDVRSNLAGIAVSGEVTLHTNPIGELPYGIYVQIAQHTFGGTILYRTCRDVSDYRGFANNWTSLAIAFGTREQNEKFAQTVYNMCAKTEQHEFRTPIGL